MKRPRKDDTTHQEPRPLRQHGRRERMESFCQAYVTNGFFAQRAALAAGYAPHSAKLRATEFLAMPEVQERITTLKREMYARMHMGRNELLARIAATARADIGYCFDEKNRVRNIKDIPAEVRTSIVAYGKDNEVRLDAKSPALALLAKHHKLLGDSLEVTGKDGAPLAAPDPIEIARRVAFLLTLAERRSREKVIA